MYTYFLEVVDGKSKVKMEKRRELRAISERRRSSGSVISKFPATCGEGEAPIVKEFNDHLYNVLVREEVE